MFRGLGFRGGFPKVGLPLKGFIGLCRGFADKGLISFGVERGFFLFTSVLLRPGYC